MSCGSALKTAWHGHCLCHVKSSCPPFSPPAIAMVADRATCLQLVGRNVAKQASEMKDCVKRGLPLPNIWLIHLMDCNWWLMLHANINWLPLPSSEAVHLCAAEYIRLCGIKINSVDYEVLLAVLQSTMEAGLVSGCNADQECPRGNICRSLWISDHVLALPCLLLLLSECLGGAELGLNRRPYWNFNHDLESVWVEKWPGTVFPSMN